MTREQKVHRWIKQWKSRWLLDHWDINVVFEDGKKPDNDGVWASCSAEVKYTDATIYIWQPFWVDANSDEQRSEVICHELAHVHTWELALLVARAQNGLLVTQHELNMADEGLTERVAKALFRAYR